MATYLSPEELRQLSRPSNLRAGLALLGDWLLIALTFAVAIAYPHPITWILCFCFMARHQLALAILMHDGAHRRLFSSTRLNDYLCQYFCGSPLLFSMYSYQKLHLKHHRDPLVEDDPDLSLIGGYPISRASFLRKLLRDISGMSYFKFIRYFIYMARQPKKAGGVAPSTLSRGDMIPLPIIASSMLLMNGLLLGSLWALSHPLLYLTLWLLPMLTGLQFLLRIRGVAEHAGYSPNPDQRLNARTVVNPLQTFFFAPHNVNYHVEHHVYPGIPFFNLPRAHKIFIERGLIPSQNLFYGYGQVLRELIR